MVDSPNGIDPNSSGVVPDAEGGTSGFAGFLRSTTGKLVLGGVALVVVLAVLAVIAFIFLFSSPAKQTSVTPTPRSGITTGTGAVIPLVSVAPVEPPERPLASTFTFRNIFAPTQAPPQPAIAPTPTVTAASTSGSVTVPPDTLFLVSIQTTDGQRTATLIWNDFNGPLPEGGVIPGSPWQVLSIGTSSVVMLFGDTQITLSTGQGLTK